MPRETAAVRALVEAAATGRGGALVLTGPPGSGRSRLVAEALHHAADLTTLVASGGRVEQRIPFAGLEHLLRPVTHLLDGLPDGQAKVVRRAVLKGRCGAGRRLRLGLAVLDVLRAAAAERPVLCCLDDVHLLDRASAETLCFVAGRLAGERIALLATWPSAGVGDPAAEGAGWGRVMVGAGVPELPLGPLEHDACRELLADLRPAGVSGPVAAAVVELSGGLPGALVDLIGALTPAQLGGSEAPPRTLPRCSAPRVGLRRWMRTLSAQAVGLLRLAAVEPALTVGEALRASQVAAVGGLDELLAAGLLVVEGDRLRFSAPWAAGAVREECSPADLRTAHATMARVLDPQSAPLRQRLHRAEARPPTPVEAVALARAAAGGPPGLATRALEHAAGAAPDTVAAADRLEGAARAAWRAGDPHRAQELTHRVEALAPHDVVRRARLQLLDGERNLRAGALSAAVGALTAAADALTPVDPAAAARALALAAEALALSGSYQRHEQVARAAGRLQLPTGQTDRTARALVRSLLGVDAIFRRDYRTARADLGAVLGAVADPGTPAADDCGLLVRAGTAAVLLGDDLTARQVARRALAAARRTGEAAAVPLALELSAYADFALGRHESAAAAAAQSVRLARATGQDGVADNGLALLAVLAAVSGDRATCHQYLRALRVTSDAEPTAQTRAFAVWALALLDLHGGRAAAAAERLRTLVADEASHRHVAVQVPATFALAEAVARWGNAPPDVLLDAGLALDVVEGWTTSTGNPTWMALAARARAQLAPEAAVAAERYRQAVRLHGAGDSDFAYARTELLFGEDLRRHRRPAEAREHLRRAAEVFVRLHEPAWSDRAESELRAAGEQSTLPRAIVVTGLTPRQEQIARLVAAGATNREVAAQMFLSTRTVDHHLRGIFTRLGVRSRTELARLIA